MKVRLGLVLATVALISGTGCAAGGGGSGPVAGPSGTPTPAPVGAQLRDNANTNSADLYLAQAASAVDAAEEAVNTGYFIVVPAGSSTRQEETWKIETQMNIQGQALDHSAMSEFVLNLTLQPEIENVRIVNTSLRKSNNETKLVDFSLDIIVSLRQSSA